MVSLIIQIKCKRWRKVQSADCHGISWCAITQQFIACNGFYGRNTYCYWLQGFAVELGNGLRCRKPILSFLNINLCLPIENRLTWRTVVFCACEETQLSSVLFYMVTAVYKFDSRLVVKETPDIWWPGERRSCCDRDLGFWQDLYFTPTTHRGC